MSDFLTWFLLGLPYWFFLVTGIGFIIRVCVKGFSGLLPWRWWEHP